MIIYQVRNNINKKIYIGKTIRTLEQRQWQHYYDAFKRNSQTYFHRSLRKYGKESFEWKVIYQCENEKELNETEIYFIDKLDSIKNGYNRTPGGTGFASGNLNPNRINPMYGKRNPFYNKHHSDEQKEKWSKTRRGKQMGSENPMIIHNIDFTGDKNPFYGKQHSQKTKDKISNSKSNLWFIITPDNKEIVFKGLRKFCLQNDLNYPSVKGAIHHKRKYRDGWTFKKLLSYRPD